MRTVLLVSVVALFSTAPVLIAPVDAAPAPAAPTTASTIVRGRVVSTRTGQPVEGATVYLTGGAGTEDIVMTTPNGWYEAEARGRGTYALVVAFGTERERRRLTLEPGRTAVVDVRIDTDPGEVIVIDDYLVPPRPPAPRTYRNGPLPYSDAAIARDAWAVAWLLLDIDRRGHVARVKFLHRPGHDLEPIALREIFKMRFHPARDRRNQPVRSQLVYQLEWPSYWWLVYRQGVTTLWGPSGHVPCRGTGPLNLDSKHPVYRDCATPDLSKAATEAWLTAADAPAR